MAAGPVDARDVEDRPAEPDKRSAQRVDLDLKGEDDGSPRIEAHHRRRAAGRAQPRRLVLGCDPGQRELADQAADGASREAGALHKAGARQWTADVHFADDGAEVGAADGLTPQPDVGPRPRNLHPSARHVIL